MSAPFLPCERADHPEDPHWHYGPRGRYWSRDYPHWDPVYVDERGRYAKNQPPAAHPDMDVDKGWTS